MRTYLLLILFTTGLSGVMGQNGQLAGKVIDARTGEELVGATVIIEGTTTGTITDFVGDFTLPNLKAGTYNFRCQFISYESQSIANVIVKANETTRVEFKLKTVELDLQEVKVVAKANRANENMLLIEQKNAVKFSEAIGAQQLSVQGVSDAATAASKMTGINKQSSSKTLFVRGLGDRYNATTLNGLPLPSNNAELKNIDLEIFSTDIIEYVGVEKAYTPQMYGDFAGGSINIQSKVFSGEPFFEVGLKLGANTNVMSANDFYLGDGSTLTGFENFEQPRSLQEYQFENSLDLTDKSGLPDGGISLTGGKSFKVGESTINLFATGSYENEFGFSNDLKRKVNGSDIVRKNLNGDTYSLSTQTIGMANLNMERQNSSYFFNTLFTNSSNNELSDFRGYIIDVAEEGAYVRRAEFERTQLMVNQLLGKHQLTPKTEVNWGVAYNSMDNIVPDRRDNIFDGTDDRFKAPADNDRGNNKRYFHEMTENELAANLSLNYKLGKAFGSNDYRGIVTLGYSGRMKEQHFASDQYNTEIKNDGKGILVDMTAIDSYFNNQNMQAGYFGLSKMPSSYNGELLIHGGFGMLEYALNPKLDVLLGLRVEHIYQKIDFNTIISQGSEDFIEFKSLPSFTMKYALSAKTNLRIALSSTYTLPQFKETAPFLFEGITESTEGNPHLYPSTDYNGELKWEFFPRAGELISVALFGKYISDPINKFVKASASNEFTYANTGDWAQIAGVEMEFRKDLFSREMRGGSQKLSLNANATLMKTQQELDKQKILKETGNSVSVNFNKSKEELEGAAPLIANLNISHQLNWTDRGAALTNSMVYNYVSDNITLIGYQSLGNQVEQQLHSLDYIIKYSVKKLGFKMAAKNLLNMDLERMQENTSQNFLVDSRNKGVRLSMTVSYIF